MKLTSVTVLMASALAMGSCSQSGSATGPSRSGGDPPPAVFMSSVGGDVYDTLFRPVAGASIEITDGSGSVVSLVTDQGGAFAAAGSFRLPLTLRASKAGLRSGTRIIDGTCCDGRVSTRLYVGSAGETVTVQPGNYTLTFIADSRCEIPDDLRVRTVDVTIAPRSPDNGRYAITISSGRTPQWGMALGVFGNQLVLNGDDDTSYLIQETLPPFRYVSYGGQAHATADGSIVSRLSMTAGGELSYCALNTDMPRLKGCYNVAAELVVERADCSSQAHRVVLEPK